MNVVHDFGQAHWILGRISVGESGIVERRTGERHGLVHDVVQIDDYAGFTYLGVPEEHA